MEPRRLCETIASAQRGSGEAFRELLEAFGPRLYGYFFRATGSHHDAEDLFGEMSLRLVRVLSSYDEHGRFEPWLFRIAANLVRDRIRRSRAGGGVMSMSQDIDGDGGTLAEQLPGNSPAADANMLAAESRLELRQALERLDPVTREMILLRHFGELSFKEISQYYRCPLGTVLAKVHRGIKTLRRQMGANDESE
jgi:RNA polymerase sigma-70 factor (ECF subfamily)